MQLLEFTDKTQKDEHVINVTASKILWNLSHNACVSDEFKENEVLLSILKKLSHKSFSREVRVWCRGCLCLLEDRVDHHKQANR